MLVTFTCPAYADITMFGNVALQLLKLMGHSGSVPGAILADDVEAALEQLKHGLASGAEAAEPEGGEDDEDGEPPISLRHRALPLLELLAAAVKAECNVMWDRNH